MPNRPSLRRRRDWLVEVLNVWQNPSTRLRRASDGQVLWELPRNLLYWAGTQHYVAGQTLYLQAEQGVAAIDIPSGKTRWQIAGRLRSVSGDRVAIGNAAGDMSIVGANGHEQWRAQGITILLHDDTAYVMTKTDLAAIDLTTNTAKWRLPALDAFASDGPWVYAWSALNDPSHQRLVIIAADTGQIAAQIPLGPPDHEPTIAAGTSTVVFGGKWVYALGPLTQPEPVRELDARACLVVQGCPGNSAPLIGAKVVVGGVATTTDRRGCFRARTKVGLAPLGLEVSGGTMAGRPSQLDNPFPSAVVFDGSVLSLNALYIGGGCHDSRPGQFP